MSRLAGLFLDPAEKDRLGVDPPQQEASHERYGLLFVDDEQQVLAAMRRIFRKENYRLYTATSGDEALALLKKEPVNVVVSDHRMPGMTGTDFLRAVKSLYPRTIRIMLTGYADVDAVMGAVNDGAVYKFITKPWNDDDLRLTVGLALEQYDLLKENRALKKQAGEQSNKIKNLTKFVNTHRSQLGRLLLQEGLISKEDMEKALARQAKTNHVLPKVLIDMQLVDERQIMSLIQEKLGVNRVQPAEFTTPDILGRLIPRQVCEKNCLAPLKKTDNMMVVALADPTDYLKLDDLAFITGLAVKPVLATQKEIAEKIKTLYGDSNLVESTLSEFEFNDPTENIEIILDEEDQQADLEELLMAKDQPPAIRIVNAIISDALRHGASDVHIEPKTKYVMVRYRIDDLLQEKLHIPLTMHHAIVSRIKIMSELDIAERRRPQDGRITVKTGARMVDMRISTLPTINGEKIVLRVLDKNATSKDLIELGLAEKDLRIVSSFIDKPQGLILTTGPTGSGKTTTIYAMLTKGAKITKNFTTIEDPVEYYMSMAEQVNVREKIGLSFSNVLRSILRQDPNVIMLGEIRDHETAEVAFHAALTGHLVLSTLHTNTAIASITRLRDIGLKSYVISDALVGVVAQRLVRKICQHCKQAHHPDAAMLAALKIYDSGFEAFAGKGCERCNNTGYKGRIGLYEVFQTDNELKRMIHCGATEQEILHSARLSGMTTLLEDALGKIRKGVTTCEEVLRVLGPQNMIEIRCANCRAMLEERYHFCPFCNAELNVRCKQCGKFLGKDWSCCPDCGMRAHSSGALGKQDKT